MQNIKHMSSLTPSEFLQLNAEHLPDCVVQVIENALQEAFKAKDELNKERKRMEVIEEQLYFAAELIKDTSNLIDARLESERITSAAASKRIKAAYNLIRSNSMFEG